MKRISLRLQALFCRRCGPPRAHTAVVPRMGMHSRLPAVTLLAGILALAACAGAGAQNLVANGSFEEPVISNGEKNEYLTSITGWTIESGRIDHYTTRFWQPAAGDQSIDMNSLEPATIYQDLATAAGAPYRLRFALAANSRPQDVKRMEVWWGSALLDTVTFDSRGRSTTNMGWIYKEYTATATGASTRLRFKSLNTGAYGPALDDVTVTATGGGGDVLENEADILVKVAAEGDQAYAGNNEYQDAPFGRQVREVPAAPRQTVEFDVKVENDSSSTRSYVVRAAESAERGWLVAYSIGDTTRTDITAAIRGNGYTTPALAPADDVVIHVQFTSGGIVVAGQTKSATFTSFLAGDLCDALRASATATADGDGNLVFNGGFERPVPENGSGITTTDVWAWGVEAGNVDLYRSHWQPAEGAQSIDLNGLAVGTIGQDLPTTAGNTYTVRFAMAGNPDGQNEKRMEVWWGNNLVDTAVFDARGHSRPNMGWIYYEYVVAATADTTRLRLKSLVTDNYGPALDDVTVRTGNTVLVRPDLLIKLGTQADADYAGGNIYQTVPTGTQVLRQSASPGATAFFDVKVENDGTSARTMTLRAAETPEPGWMVLYKVGSVDVSSLVRGTGYLVDDLAPGAAAVIRVEMTPGPSVHAQTEKRATLQVLVNGTVHDAVQGIATATAGANLVVNGTFERPVVANGVKVDGTADLAGWVAESGNVDLCARYWQPAEGHQSVDLNGLAPASIYQDLVTRAGTIYTLRFALAGNPDDPGRKRIEVFWGGSRLDTVEFDSQGRTRSQMGWVYRKYFVTAAGAQTRLQFRSATQGAGGPALDDISVCAAASAEEMADLLIKRGSATDSAYSLNGEYQTTPGGTQVVRQSLARGGTATYDIMVQNDGARTRTLVLRAAESLDVGWDILYTAGSADITACIRSGGGYVTPLLAPGASAVIRVTMAPGTGVATDTDKSVTVEVYVDGKLSDSVRATALLPLSTQADLLIKSAGESDSAFALDNVYQAQPSGDQIRQKNVAVGGQAVYHLKIQNDTTTGTARQFLLKAAEGAGVGWALSYTAGSSNVTAAIRGSAGYMTPSLRPGASLAMTVTVTATSAAIGGSEKHTVITIHRPDMPEVADAVQAGAAVPALLEPDLLAKKVGAPDSDYAANGVYAADPVPGQSVAQTVSPGRQVTYLVRLDNDNNLKQSRAYVLKAAEGGEPGWTITYKLGSLDISSRMRGSAGYTTPILAPGRSLLLTVTALAGSSAPGGRAKNVAIRSFLTSGDWIARDCVQLASTVTVAHKADALIKRASEADSLYGLNGVYQATPSGTQVETQSVLPRATVVTHVKVENDGNAARAFVVKAAEAGAAGWTVSYKVASSNITTSIRGAGGYATPSLAPRASLVIQVEMAPPPGAAAGSTVSSTVRVFLAGTDAVAQDAVKATAKLAASYLADLLIKKASDPDSAYATDNAYESEPSTAQTRSAVVPPGGKAVFAVKVQNDGNLPVSYLLKAADAGAAGWTVLYKRGATNVTASIRGSTGSRTVTLAVGASAVLTVEIVPGATAAPSSSYAATIKVFRAGSEVVLDSVQAAAALPATTGADLLIKKASDPESAYALNDIYQSTPAGEQVETQSLARAGSVMYSVKVQNDAAVSRTFVLRAQESAGAGWRIAYRIGTTDITAEITAAAGYGRRTLAAGASYVVTVEVTATATAAGGTTKSVTIQSREPADTRAQDAVQAVTRLDVVVQPDLLIKGATEPDWLYTIDNTYQAAPSGSQARTQSLLPGGIATFRVKVQNDGNTARTFLLKARGNDPVGWTTAFAVGSEYITAVIAGAAGWTTPVLAPGQSAVVTVEMMPDSAVPPTTRKSVIISAYGDARDTTVRDAVSSSASVAD